MRLHTIQDADFWLKCQDAGGIFVDRRFVTQDFLESYEWMCEQMVRRLPAYSGDFPVWAWADRPDLRTISWKAKGHALVLLTIEVPHDRVLLSDFPAWHYVLNDWYLAADDRDFEREEMSPATKAERRASWERIFDLDPPHDDWNGPNQACVDRVYLDEVLKARPFKSRGPNTNKLATAREAVRPAGPSLA